MIHFIFAKFAARKKKITYEMNFLNFNKSLMFFYKINKKTTSSEFSG